jgi:ribosomally synthesized peptide (two-chain TOMM family)
MPRNNDIPTYESLLEFQEVYLRAIALAWTDEQFKQLFLLDPRGSLRNYFGYDIPWNVDLKVQEANGPGDGWDPVTRKWQLPPMRTSFGVPKAPKVEEQLVAFAAYNDGGPSYLFTCC